MVFWRLGADLEVWEKTCEFVGFGWKETLIWVLFLAGWAMTVGCWELPLSLEGLDLN